MGDLWRRFVAQLNKPLFQSPPPPRMPPTPFGEIRDGAIVRVVGRARSDGEPWITPLSGQQAASWTWRASQFLVDGNRRWDLLEETDFGQVFWVENEEAQRVRVERKGDSVIRRRPVTLVGKPRGQARARIDAFLDHSAHRAQDHFYGFGRDYRYREWCVPSGALVSVTGQAELAPDAQGLAADGYRGAPHRVTLGPSASDTLIIEFEEE